MGEQNDLDAVTPVAGQISLRSQILDPKDRVFDFHAGRFESRNPLGGNVEPGAKVDRPVSKSPTKSFTLVPNRLNRTEGSFWRASHLEQAIYAVRLSKTN
jgi:hypothetical protein